ncbi:zinc finger and SCAN domain-containing protein 2-like isoform X2 [Cheilinus undulatus]|uniref:zinc finger and SCAN domain-containing protein 2-like isoform X2 n=1 Tax=Cheilinus undulatus TaxID=241271 RepID=UPI001BD21225|nr:zinc finger and SCAN domain-containing protein 2-like isoform X2 [Cheilinus undulatus]
MQKDLVKSAKVQMLRSSVNQRLTAAAEEIFELFERTNAEYEEQLRSKEENGRQQKLQNAVIRPEDIQQLMVRNEEVPPKQQERSSSLNQEITGPPLIIAEPQELWISQEGEQLQGAEETGISRFTLTPVPVKREEDGVKHQSSQSCPTQTEEHLKTEAVGENFDQNTYLQPITPGEPALFSGSDTDNSGDWEMDDKPQQPPHKRNKTHTGENSHNHVMRHSIEKPFDCSGCRRNFIWRAEMVTQMKIRTGEKTLKCSVCGKTFSQRLHLKQHSFVHTGVKPFSCKVCDKKFTQQAYIKKHFCAGNKTKNK